ncbi:MAG TPA: TetR/AcrR family transcriptional regulator [Acetobacteraceae bacterium]|nr:TetR/AcrR family transcriptional regulator [Acetobacteraceae bacterium]
MNAETGLRARPRRSGRPSAVIAARLPALLLDAAETLFLAQGYSATSLEQVASEAGATKRTIYAKFGDKAGLFSAMAERVVERRRAWVSGECVGATVDERLLDFGKRLLALALAPDVLSLHRVLVAEAHRFPQLASLVDQLAAESAHNRLAGIIAAEAAGGALEVADPALAADLLVGMILNAPVLAGLLERKSAASVRPARWVRTAVSVFLDGSRPKGRRTAGTRRPVSPRPQAAQSIMETKS